jgi:ribosomal protein S18 acetylase RimI-like enzyme
MKVSTMSNIEVLPLAEAQLEDAARALALAFQDDPLQSYVLPDPEERALRSPAHFSTLLRYGHLFGEAVTTQGTPEGAAIWQPPGVDVTPERAVGSGLNRLLTLIGADALQRLGRVLDYLEAVHHRDLPPDHWYLMVVGVVPARQGQGVGRALLQPILNRADSAGLPCCLDTAQPQNVPFYQKLGFRVLAETVEPESGLRLWSFRRDPP